jgi:hypothetical protein
MDLRLQAVDHGCVQYPAEHLALHSASASWPLVLLLLCCCCRMLLAGGCATALDCIAFSLALDALHAHHMQVPQRLQGYSSDGCVVQQPGTLLGC